MFLGGGVSMRVFVGMIVFDDCGVLFNYYIMVMWMDFVYDVQNVVWMRVLSMVMKFYVIGCVYVNFIGDEGEEWVIVFFGGCYECL